MADKNIGAVTGMRQHSPGNNYWAAGMNENLIKMMFGLAPSVISKSTARPSVGTEGDTYLVGGNVHIWIDDYTDESGTVEGGWKIMTPVVGLQIFVRDVNEIWLFDESQEWVRMIALDAPYIPVQRELKFYAPGLVRPGAVMFKYVATMPFAVEAGAPGSGAHLEIAPSGGSAVFPITCAGVQVASITFASGSTTGVVSWPDRTVIHNALPDENKYARAQELLVYAPGNPRGATGLNVSLRGEIWEKD
jgi:hypothetical protein